MPEPYVEMRTMYKYDVVVESERGVHGRWTLLACTKRDAEDAVKETVGNSWGFPDTLKFIATRTSQTPKEVAVVCH